MKVYPISNNQQQFQGNVGKSVYKYLNSAVQNESQIIIKDAKANNKEVNKDEVNKISILVANIQNRLARYMRNTHNETVLEMGNTNYKNYPRFNNPVSSHTVRIYSPLSDYNTGIDNNGEIAIPKLKIFSPIKKAGMKDLKNFSKFCDELENKINAQDIDKTFYNIEKAKLIKNQNENEGLFAGIRNILKDIEIRKFIKDSKNVEELNKMLW